MGLNTDRYIMVIPYSESQKPREKEFIKGEKCTELGFGSIFYLFCLFIIFEGSLCTPR